jgi:hypothetical protein
MQQEPVDIKVAESEIERLEAEMDERGLEHIKPVSSDARPIQGRRAALAEAQRRHYKANVRRVRQVKPRFKGFRTTQPSGGAPVMPGPSEKALARAAQSRE